ncbi:hypothetical protein H4R35_003534 [Dimargaris xerosporica]|nr:hypothetical protein H4R35_003534 [Dimargaris xerosporica]
MAIAEDTAQPAYVQGDTSVPLIMATTGDVFDQTCQKHPDRLAVVFCEENIRWTYRQLSIEVMRVAANLYDLGLRQGDQVGIFMSNYSPIFLLQLAAARLGAVVVMFHTTFLAHELEHALQLTDCKVLVVQPSYKTTDCIQLLLQLLPELETSDSCQLRSAKFPSLTAVFVAECRGVGIFGHHQLCPTHWRRVSGLACFYTFVALPYSQATVAAICRLDVKPTDPICVLFTSGSTGHPKAVVSTHCPMYVDQMFHPAFGQFNISSLQCALMSGSNCPAQVRAEITRRFQVPQLLTIFGMTEQTIHTTGTPFPHVEAKVVDVQTGQLVHVGQRGELLIRGPSVMTGYLNNPEKSREAIGKDGWLKTGDIAEMDAQGYFRIIDRKKDMIIKGGVNIYPGEIEQCLIEHPNIQNVAVIGVAHEWMEEEVCACVVLKVKAAPLTLGAVRKYCKGRLSAFKVPGILMVFDSLPLTSTAVQAYHQRPSDHLDQVCQDYPDNPAFIFCEENISWTFQQLNTKATRVAAKLYDLGVRPGDRLGVFMSNYSPVCLMQLAAARLGAVMVQFHTSFLAHELEYAMALTECKILVVQPSHKTTDCTQLLLQLIPELETCQSNALHSLKFPLLTAVLVADCSTMDAAGYHRLCTTNWRRIAGLTCFETFALGPVSPASAEAVQKLEVKAVHPISILLTSGSTGQPKAVTVSHFGVLNAGYCNHRQATLKALQTYRCTYYLGVGTMYADLLAHPDFEKFDLSSLKCGIIGGSNCPASGKAEFIQRLGLTSLISNYGMTEGKYPPHVEAKIVNINTGKTAAVGERGEVHLRSEYTML